MGIRKGWALCGAREERCFISHAVSSHPLLELQTLGLSTLSSPHHQDLPLDSIQKKISFHPSTPTSLLYLFCQSFLFLSSPLLYLSPGTPIIIASQKTGNSVVANFIYHFYHFFFFKIKREKSDQILEVLVVREHIPAYSFFFVLQLSRLPHGYHSWFCTCKWYGRESGVCGGGGATFGFTPPPPPPPPPRLLLLLLFPGWSRNGLASRSTPRNHGHGVSLGKQRPGQQGFTQTLIIQRAISGGSPPLYTWLELLSLIVQSPLWLWKMD